MKFMYYNLEWLFKIRIIDDNKISRELRGRGMQAVNEIVLALRTSAKQLIHLPIFTARSVKILP